MARDRAVRVDNDIDALPEHVAQQRAGRQRLDEALALGANSASLLLKATVA